MQEIKTIENMPINPLEKMELALLKKDLKKAAEIYLYSDSWKFKKESGRKVDPRLVKSIEDYLQKAGLVFKTKKARIDNFATIEDDSIPVEDIKPRDEISMAREVVEIAVSKNKRDLADYLEAVEKGLDGKMGELYGYPQTAVEAYLKQDKSGEETLLSNKEKLPVKHHDKDYFVFANFRFSKKNWPKELDTVKKWAKTVKEASPKIYNEYVDFMTRTGE